MTDLGLPIKNSSNHITLQGHCEEGKSICRYGERRIEKGEAAVDKSNTHKQEAAEIGADAQGTLNGAGDNYACDKKE